MPDRAPAATAHFALLILMVLLTAWTPVASRDAMYEMPPLSTGFFRFGAAGLFLALTALVLPRKGPTNRRIARRDWPRMLLAAALCVPINQSLFLTGVKLANSSHAALFYALTPVLLYIITVWLGQAQLSTRMTLAALLAFAGAAVVGWDGFSIDGGSSMLAGDLNLFGAVLSYAAYSVAVRPLSARYGAVRTLAIVMLGGSVLYLPALWIDGHLLNWSTLGWRALFGFAYITIGTSYLNYMLWLVAMNRIEINRLSVMINASPLVAVLFAWLWHNEPISAYLSLGAALIFVAITLANWDRMQALLGRGQRDLDAAGAVGQDTRGVGAPRVSGENRQ